jgi:hypothetical protein
MSASNSYRVKLADDLLKYAFIEAIGPLSSAEWKDFQALMQQALRSSPPPESNDGKQAIELLRRLRKAGIIFPSMCANNGEAYRFLIDMREFLERVDATSRLSGESNG